MTWYCTWPHNGTPAYKEHPTEAAAEEHARALVRAREGEHGGGVLEGRRGDECMSERISGTAGEWQTLTVRFRPGDDIAKVTDYGESVTAPIGKALMEAFELDAVDIDTVNLVADRRWRTMPADFNRQHYGICPKCREEKFIGHGPLCIDCYLKPTNPEETPA